MKQYIWTPVDTASIMFSALSNKKWGRTCRISSVVREGEVNPERLKQAVEDVLPRFPSFRNRLRIGFFWNYLEHTDALPEIRRERETPVLPIHLHKEDTPDFRIVYDKKKFSIDCSHCLADGMGILSFFASITARYFELTDNPITADGLYVRSLTEKATEEEFVNAFDAFYRKGETAVKRHKPSAYHFPQKPVRNDVHLTFVKLDNIKVYNEAKKRNITVTEYLVSLLILGILRTAEQPIKKEITIAVPVNLRRFFPTKNTRNFTVQSFVTFRPNGTNNHTLDEICDTVRGQLAQQLTKENLQTIINGFGRLTTNPVLRIAPCFLKKPVLTISQRHSHGCVSTILTNLGKPDLPSSLCGQLSHMEAVNGDTSRYGLVSSVSSITVNDVLTLCFSVCGKPLPWVDICIDILREQGFDVTVEHSDDNLIPVGLPDSVHCPVAGKKASIFNREHLKAIFRT